MARKSIKLCKKSKILTKFPPSLSVILRNPQKLEWEWYINHIISYFLKQNTYDFFKPYTEYNTVKWYRYYFLGLDSDQLKNKKTDVY